MDIAHKLKKIFVISLTLFIVGVFAKSNLNAATFSLSPSAGSFEIGCTRSIDILVNATAQSANAAEIEIAYDSAQISVIDQDGSTAGTQVQTGDAFNAYFVNNVNSGTGRIRVAGANFFTNLTSQKLLAKIVFTALPGATASNFTIQFTGVGNTLDSNIADSNTNQDLLTAVTNGSYTYTVGSCSSDTQTPIINFTSPTNGQTGVAVNSNVVVNITDNSSGIDLNTVEFIINGVTYTPADPEVIQSGSSNNYTFTINPSSDFPVGQAVAVVVNATDNAGNTVTNTLIFNQPAPPPPAPGDVEPPVVTFINPINLDVNVNDDDTISFTVTDNVGLDVNTLVVTLNGETYTNADTEITSTGTQTNITFTLSPRVPINPDGLNILTVTGQDLSGNNFERTIVFNVPPDGEPPECEIEDVPVADPGSDEPSSNGGAQTPCEYFQTTPTTVQVVDNLLKGDDKLLKGTVFENTFVDQAVSESGVSALSSISISLLLLANLLPFLAAPGLLVEYIGILFGRRRKDPWGVITDITTGKPIAFSVCQLYLKGSNYKISQTVSDLQGRYSFITDPGEYRREISQSGYKKFITNISISKDTRKQNVDVALVPYDRQVDYRSNLAGKIIDTLKRIYRKSFNFLFYIGFISSLVAIVISINFVNLAFLAFYIVIFISILYRRSSISSGKSSVVDSETGFRIPYAQVKIYDPTTLRLVDSVVTNFSGYFDYFGAAGEFAMLVVARGYKFPGKNNKYTLAKKSYNSMILVNLRQGNNLITIEVDPSVSGNQSGSSFEAKPTLESPFGGSKKSAKVEPKKIEKLPALPENNKTKS